MNWISDINQLAQELPKLHNNFFLYLKEKEFYERVEKLQSLEKELNIYSMVVELAKLIALAGDAHTALEIPKNNMLPMECYWFEEGIYITGTTPEFEEVLHQKVIEIEGVAISEIVENMTEMISHENMQFVKSLLSELLVCTDILYGLGIATSVEKVEIKTESLDGKQISLIMSSIINKDWGKMVKMSKMSKMSKIVNTANTANEESKSEETSSTNTQNIVLSRKNRDSYYWDEVIEEGGILYVNYNKCKEMESLSTENFIGSLKERLEMDLRIESIVLDYRNNNGGNSELFKPFIEWLSDFQKERNENSKQPFKIFVIVGRETFSSALLNVYLLKFKTKAVFVGEATGGKPNCYGEVKYFRLKESGLSVRYSTRYYYIIEEYWQDSFYPDINFPVSFRDYLEGRDPCVEWIIKEAINNGE